MPETLQRKKNRHPVLRFIRYRILHIDDSPHKIALGLAIGLFIAWTPALGLHILMVLALCILLKANKFVAITSVWVSNIFTFVPIYYPSYLVGRTICLLFQDQKALTQKQVVEIFNNIFSPMNLLKGFYHKEYWVQVWHLLKNIGPELWVGGFVIGGVIAIGSYFICYRMIKLHRLKHPHKRFAKYQE